MSKIRILFKSGNSILIEAESFSLARTGEEITKLEWKNTKPSMMFISLPAIEAIFEEK